MENDASCGIKKLLRRIFRKKSPSSEAATAGTQSNPSVEETRRITIDIVSVGEGYISRDRKPLHLRHFTRENSLAPYLGRDGEHLVLKRTKVSIFPVSDKNPRDTLKQEQRVSCPGSDGFDSFTEASASCPIAEESFDSGLLKMTTPWFMDTSE